LAGGGGLGRRQAARGGQGSCPTHLHGTATAGGRGGFGTEVPKQRGLLGFCGGRRGRICAGGARSGVGRGRSEAGSLAGRGETRFLRFVLLRRASVGMTSGGRRERRRPGEDALRRASATCPPQLQRMGFTPAFRHACKVRANTPVGVREWTRGGKAGQPSPPPLGIGVAAREEPFLHSVSAWPSR